MLHSYEGNSKLIKDNHDTLVSLLLNKIGALLCQRKCFHLQWICMLTEMFLINIDLEIAKTQFASISCEFCPSFVFTFFCA